MLLYGIKDLLKNENNFYVNFLLNSNTTDASDGEYFAKDECTEWRSDSKVIVRGGLIDIKSLAMCTSEILNKSKYHGRFLESCKFDGKYFQVFIGS